MLLQYYRQPAGHEPLSFCSETCIFLAALRIILLIVEHYNGSIEKSITITSKIHLFTDSKNMIKNFTTMNKYQLYTSNVP